MRKQKCTHRDSNSKINILSFNLELVTRKRKNKSLTIELELEVKLNTLQLRVSDSKFISLFFHFELVTRSVTFCF